MITNHCCQTFQLCMFFPVNKLCTQVAKIADLQVHNTACRSSNLAFFRMFFAQYKANCSEMSVSSLVSIPTLSTTACWGQLFSKPLIYTAPQVAVSYRKQQLLNLSWPPNRFLTHWATSLIHCFPNSGLGPICGSQTYCYESQLE